MFWQALLMVTVITPYNLFNAKETPCFYRRAGFVGGWSPSVKLNAVQFHAPSKAGYSVSFVRISNKMSFIFWQTVRVVMAITQYDLSNVKATPGFYRLAESADGRSPSVNLNTVYLHSPSKAGYSFFFGTFCPKMQIIFWQTVRVVMAVTQYDLFNAKETLDFYRRAKSAGRWPPSVKLNVIPYHASIKMGDKGNFVPFWHKMKEFFW